MSWEIILIAVWTFLWLLLRPCSSPAAIKHWKRGGGMWPVYSSQRCPFSANWNYARGIGYDPKTMRWKRWMLKRCFSCCPARASLSEEQSLETKPDVTLSYYRLMFTRLPLNIVPFASCGPTGSLLQIRFQTGWSQKGRMGIASLYLKVPVLAYVC